VPGLAQRTLKNAVYSVMEFGWPILIALVATPYVVRTLGADAYGVLSIVGVTLGFFGFLDLGMGGAAVRQFAAAHERGDADGINAVLGTVLTFYIIVGLTGAALIAALAVPLAGSVLSIPAAVRSVAVFAFYMAAPGFMVSLVLQTFGSIPKSIQRFDVSTKINIVVGTLNTASTVLMLHLGQGLRGVVVASFLVNCLALVAAYIVATRLVPTLRVRLTVDRPLFREMFTFGGWFLMASIGVAVLYQLDKLLVGAFLGVGQVTYYVVPGNLAGKIQGLIAAATAISFPVSAALFGGGHHDGLKKLYREGTRMVFIVATTIAVPMAVFADRFLYYWMGPDIASHSGLVMVLLVATYYLLAVTSIPWGIANGAGRAKINAVFVLGIAALDVAIFLAVVRAFGIAGAAAAFLASAIVGVPALIVFTERRVVGLSGVEFLGIYWRIGIVGALQGGLSWLARPLVTNLATALILMAASACLFPLLYRALGFLRDGDRRIASMLVDRLRGREPAGDPPSEVNG
jgi:O-antigen/teichoic acid export membrane protein